MVKAMIVIGEALVEVMRPSAGSPLDQEGSFSGPFASGAPAIFAVAAARLGYPVRFIGSVGEDAFGRLLRNRLWKEGVDVTGLHHAAGYATGVAFVAYALDGSREFVFHLRHSAAGRLSAEQMDPAAFDNLGWLHLSGSTLALNESCRAACWRAVEQAKAAGGRVSFDPNLRPELMGIDEARTAFARFIEQPTCWCRLRARRKPWQELPTMTRRRKPFWEEGRKLLFTSAVPWAAAFMPVESAWMCLAFKCRKSTPLAREIASMRLSW
jgi:sugar/nucleoside kinase (ribokinase family)